MTLNADAMALGELTFSAHKHELLLILVAAVAAAQNAYIPYGFEEMCKQSFAADFWGQRASVFNAQSTSRSSFFDLGDLAGVLRAANASLHVAGGTVKSGRTSSSSPQPFRKKGGRMDYFRNSTLTLSAIEMRVPKLAMWSREFAQVYGVTCEMNLYLTAPGSQAFSIHNDKQDVFATQILGEKVWKVWDLQGLTLDPDIGMEPVLAPFRHTISYTPKNNSSPIDVFPTPSLDISLVPGRMLYIPRGSLHVASTAGSTDYASLHITVGALTQTFSYAIAAFNVASTPEVKQAIAAVSWDLHRFRQALMKMADHKLDGVPFRRSLPLGLVWQFRNQFGNTSCVKYFPAISSTQGQLAAKEEEVRSTLQLLLRQVFRQAPLQMSSPLELTMHAVYSAVAVFIKHLDKFDAELKPVTSGRKLPIYTFLELPEQLHVTYIGWGSRDESSGEVLAIFSWCGRGDANAKNVTWPVAVLPMVQAVASSPSRRLSLDSLAPMKDPIPKLIFAIELEQLHLTSPIRLLPANAPALENDHRDANCANHVPVEL